MLNFAGAISGLRNRLLSAALCFTGVAIVIALVAPTLSSVIGGVQSQSAASSSLWPISIDYPEDGSIFPPGITPPTFLWRDGIASYWTIDITLPGDPSPIHVVSKGERMRLGPIDPDCVSDTNELPSLNPQQA